MPPAGSIIQIHLGATGSQMQPGYSTRSHINFTSPGKTSNRWCYSKQRNRMCFNMSRTPCTLMAIWKVQLHCGTSLHIFHQLQQVPRFGIEILLMSSWNGLKVVKLCQDMSVWHMTCIPVPGICGLPPIKESQVCQMFNLQNLCIAQMWNQMFYMSAAMPLLVGCQAGQAIGARWCYLIHNWVHNISQPEITGNRIIQNSIHSNKNRKTSQKFIHFIHCILISFCFSLLLSSIPQAALAGCFPKGQGPPRRLGLMGAPPCQGLSCVMGCFDGEGPLKHFATPF